MGPEGGTASVIYLRMHRCRAALLIPMHQSNASYSRASAQRCFFPSEQRRLFPCIRAVLQALPRLHQGSVVTEEPLLVVLHPVPLPAPLHIVLYWRLAHLPCDKKVVRQADGWHTVALELEHRRRCLLQRPPHGPLQRPDKGGCEALRNTPATQAPIAGVVGGKGLADSAVEKEVADRDAGQLPRHGPVPLQTETRVGW